MTTPDSEPGILHHTALQQRGGALRVAEILCEHQLGEGSDARMSFEMAEDGSAAGIRPEAFGPQLLPNQVPHLHASTDWAALLGSIPEDTHTIITLHDCNLITGGCPFPLDCPHFAKGCENPCPRGFSASQENRKAKQEQLDRLRPMLVSPSRWLANLAREALPGHKVRIIPNGIPWPATCPSKAQARASLGMHPNARAVLFAAHGGFQAAYKAGHAWQDIWGEVRRKQPGAVGFAVGGERAGEENGLTLWPYVDREKLSLLMAACDCLAYPTLADNHSLLILEAMTSALPVIAPPVGGVPEQIVDGVNGILSSPDTATFAHAIAELLSHPARVRELGHNAYTQGAKRFTATRMARQYARLYQPPRSGLQPEKNKESHP